MPLFSPSASITSKLVLCVVLSILMMTVDHRFKQLYPGRAALSTAIDPLQPNRPANKSANMAV
jgi:cell shape-determining protein MreC